MKLNLDENVHTDVASVLRAQGHDVLTVHDQGLAGRPDADLARAVRAEGRGIVTFDLDFADPRLCPPDQIATLTRFFSETPAIAGRLWIVEHTRARDWTP